MSCSLKNLKTTDYDVILEKIALEPTYATILDDKGKEIKKLNSPAFVRHFEVDTWNDVKEDVSGKLIFLDEQATSIVLK